MLVIPTGLDKTELRRTPVVTIVLVALIVAGFLLKLPSGVLDRKLEEKTRQAVDYLLEHPYLEPPEDLRHFLGKELEDAHQSAKQGYLSTRTVPDFETRATERAQLAVLVNEMLSLQREQGPSSWGWVPRHPRVLALLSHLFVHGGWLHLLGNLVFLWVAGPFLEDVYGRVVYPLLYFTSGIAAAHVHAWQDPHSVVPLIGASGAIAGVLAGFLVKLGKSNIQFLFLPIPILWFLRFRFDAPAFVVLPLWFLQQFFSATSEAESNVAFWAHVGGFAYGALFAVFLQVSRIESRYISKQIDQKTSWSVDSLVEAANAARSEGNVHRARLKIDEALKRSPGDVDALRLAYEISLDARDGEEIARRATRLLEAYGQKGEGELALALTREARGTSEVLPGRFHYLAGFVLEKGGHLEEALQSYKAAVRAGMEELSAFQSAIRAFPLEKSRGNTATARRIAQFALNHPACDASWKKKLEGDLASMP